MLVDKKVTSNVKHWGTSRRFGGGKDEPPGKGGKGGAKKEKPKGAVPGPGKYNVTSNWLIDEKNKLAK